MSYQISALWLGCRHRLGLWGGALLFALGLAGTAQAGSSTLTVNVKGIVVAPTCELADKTMEVDFGTFDIDGSNAKKEFSVQLKNCTDTNSIDVKVSGTPSTLNTDLLALASTSKAKGIAIRFLMQKGEIWNVLRVNDNAAVNIGFTGAAPTLTFAAHAVKDGSKFNVGAFSASANLVFNYK